MKRIITFFLIAIFASAIVYAGDVEKWDRFVITIDNPSYSGNPFEIEVDATFTLGGTTITLPGYYAGNDQWKIGFMPTEDGTWTYTTSSIDTELDGVTGSIVVDPSTREGVLKADPSNAKKWKFVDGGYVVPIALRTPFFSEDATIGQFTTVADFMQTNNLHMLETRLNNEYIEGSGLSDPVYMFSGNWQNHQMDLAVWDRMEERMNILSDRGLGAHVMFYADDAGEPLWGGGSATERFIERYVVARLAGYPIVFWNYGIDIGEFRTNSQINAWVSRMKSLDPYEHPISSRYGGGSGGVAAIGQTFDSKGGPNQALVDDFISAFNSANVPVSMDDAWGENRGSHASKDHTPADIRRAFWKTTIAGGLGGMIRGGCDGGAVTGCYTLSNMQSDLESEQWLRHINPFIENTLGNTFGTMVPVGSLATNAYAISDPSRSKILYFYVGNQDTYDSTSGDFTVSLTGITGSFNAEWFNPRNAQVTVINPLVAGQNHVMTPPSADDWVLYLYRDACQDGATQSCYTGPAGTENVGTCVGGIQTCNNGAWGSCVGQVLPSADVCGNGIDENCDGNDASCSTSGLANGLVTLYHFDAAATPTTPLEDFSGNNHDGTCTSTTCPVFTASGKYGGAYDFDGDNPPDSDAINLGTNAVNSLIKDFTVSAWINPDEVNQASAIIGVDGRPGWIFGIENGQIWFEYPGTQGFSTNVNIAAGQWQHVAAVINENHDVDLYLDGVFQQTLTACCTIGVNTADSYFISDSSNWLRFNGKIDDLAVWNRQLTSQEISDVFNLNGPITTAECTDGQTRTCGNNVGACVAGTETCVGGSWSGSCVGGVLPIAEICDNGVDDSCDGQVDENCGCAEDINNDNNIDMQDLLSIVSDFGSSPPNNLAADLNGDNIISVFDLVIAANKFGQTC